MPELPEVEVAARNLRRWLRGTIVAASAAPSRIVRGGRPAELERLLVGSRVHAVERRGKWLRLLVDGGAVYSHLGMTGKWVRRPAAAPPEKYERARIDVRGASVRYCDPRLFGRLLAVPGGGDIPQWRALGPDPLVDGIDRARLGAALGRTRRSIKEALLDQTLLAGVGNIQAAEALWRAKIDPQRRASSLSRAEVAALVRGIERSIADTLADEDGPEITYVEEAGAPNPFRVYGKHGQPCPRCRATLKRIVQAGRSTVFCPRCQVRRVT